jgi:hypothetical protein
MKRKFKYWWSTISTKLRWRHMVIAIHVLTWDRHIYVAVLIGTVKSFHLTFVHYGCILLSSTELCTCITWIITFVNTFVTFYFCLRLWFSWLSSSSLVFSGVRVAGYLIFCVMFCTSLFILLFFLFWPLCCLSFFDLRILITPLKSSNSS